VSVVLGMRDIVQLLERLQRTNYGVTHQVTDERILFYEQPGDMTPAADPHANVPGGGRGLPVVFVAG